MKQLWFGAGLLILLLVCGIWLGTVLEDTHLPAAKDLDKAARYALADDWDLASALFARAEKNWQARRRVAAALVHHDPLDKIDTLFTRLKIYRSGRNAAAFSAGCAELAQHLQNLPQSHRFTWWNFL